MIYAFGDFVLDASRRELLRGEAAVHLQPQVFDLLLLLVANSHRVLSRDEIIEKVWSGRIVSDDAITSRIRDLRRALADPQTPQEFIRTLRGRGFRFVGDVALRGVAHQVPSGAVSAAPSVEPPQKAQPSIAVLPFQRNGDFSAFEAIEEAIPRELIATLASLRWIKVISHGSAFRFRGPHVDLSEVARILKAKYCLTGVVEITGPTITIDTELSDTGTSEVIWAMRKQAPIDDIHALRNEIAANIITVAEFEIPQHEAAAVHYLDAENLDAWSAMHVGFRNLNQFSRRGNEIAEGMLQRAIAQEPRLARAHAGMAFVRFQNAFMRYADDVKAEGEAARAFAEQALALQPRDPFANFMMGRCHWLSHDPGGSKQWFSRAIEASPNYTWGYYGSSWADVFTEEFDSGLISADRAIDLSPIDPFRPGMTGNKMWIYLAREDYAEAVKWAEIAARTPWAHAGMAMFAAMSHWLNGSPERAADWMREVHRRNPDFSLQNLQSLVPSTNARFSDLVVRAAHQLRL